jgi:hypothetical protein
VVCFAPSTVAGHCESTLVYPCRLIGIANQEMDKRVAASVVAELIAAEPVISKGLRS